MAVPRVNFEAALKEARLAEAVHLDAIMNVKDARALRLNALREALMPHVADHPAAAGLVELTIQPGETPRLWLDLISSVVIEPDSRNYRLEQEREGRREILFETDKLDDMTRHVLKFLAHRVIARERSAAGLGAFAVSDNGKGYGLGAIIYVWATGFVFGIAALMILSILLGLLHF